MNHTLTEILDEVSRRTNDPLNLAYLYSQMTLEELLMLQEFFELHDDERAKHLDYSINREVVAALGPVED